MVFAVAGFALSHVAAQQATDTYRDILYEASKTADYGEKVALYGEANAVPDKAGEKDAYLALIQTYKNNDSRFSVEEANQLTKYIKSNKAALQRIPPTIRRSASRPESSTGIITITATGLTIRSHGPRAPWSGSRTCWTTPRRAMQT